MQILSDATVTHSTDDDLGINGMINKKKEISSVLLFILIHVCDKAL